MANELGKIALNFQVEDTGDPELIIVKDFSKWRVIENLPSYIEVTLPGARKPVVLPYEKNATNAFNSLSLGITCHVDCEENISDLPDGIYEFLLRGGKDGLHQFHRYYLKKDTLQTALDKAWFELGVEYIKKEEDSIKRLIFIEGYLRAASSSTRLGHIKEASDYFKMAESELREYYNCK